MTYINKYIIQHIITLLCAGQVFKTYDECRDWWLNQFAEHVRDMCENAGCYSISDENYGTHVIGVLENQAMCGSQFFKFLTLFSTEFYGIANYSAKCMEGFGEGDEDASSIPKAHAEFFKKARAVAIIAEEHDEERLGEWFEMQAKQSQPKVA